MPIPGDARNPIDGERREHRGRRRRTPQRRARAAGTTWRPGAPRSGVPRTLGACDGSTAEIGRGGSGPVRDGGKPSRKNCAATSRACTPSPCIGRPDSSSARKSCDSSARRAPVDSNGRRTAPRRRAACTAAPPDSNDRKHNGRMTPRRRWHRPGVPTPGRRTGACSRGGRRGDPAAGAQPGGASRSRRAGPGPPSACPTPRDPRFGAGAQISVADRRFSVHRATDGGRGDGREQPSERAATTARERGGAIAWHWRLRIEWRLTAFALGYQIISMSQYVFDYRDDPAGRVRPGLKLARTGAPRVSAPRFADGDDRVATDRRPRNRGLGDDGSRGDWSRRRGPARRELSAGRTRAIPRHRRLRRAIPMPSGPSAREASGWPVPATNERAIKFNGRRTGLVWLSHTATTHRGHSPQRLPRQIPLAIRAYGPSSRWLPMMSMPPPSRTPPTNATGYASSGCIPAPTRARTRRPQPIAPTGATTRALRPSSRRRRRRPGRAGHAPRRRAGQPRRRHRAGRRGGSACSRRRPRR